MNLLFTQAVEHLPMIRDVFAQGNSGYRSDFEKETHDDDKKDT